MNNSEDIVIVGGGGFTKCIANYIKNNPTFHILGYTDIEDKGKILDIKYLGKDDQLKKLYESGVKYAVPGVGIRLNDSSLKCKIVKKLIEIGFKIPSLFGQNVVIHKGAIIEEGVVVRDGAIIQSGTLLKSYSMIGDNVVISHDTIVNSFAHIVAGSIVGRDCSIGNSAFIGYGSTILNEIEIGPEVLIGAHSLVNKNCLKKGIYYGVPAKLKNSKYNDEK